MSKVKYRPKPRSVFPINVCAPSDRFIPPTASHGYTSVASGFYSVHKTLPLRLANFGELQPARWAHTIIGKAREFPHPCRQKNSFIVAKTSEPFRFSCNPGALLLLPPSFAPGRFAAFLYTRCRHDRHHQPSRSHSPLTAGSHHRLGHLRACSSPRPAGPGRHHAF